MSVQQYWIISCSDLVGVIKNNTQERENLTQSGKKPKTFGDNHQRCHITLGPAVVAKCCHVKLKQKNGQTAHKAPINTHFANLT